MRQGLLILRKVKLSNTVMFTIHTQAAVLLAAENAPVVARAIDALDDAEIQLTPEMSVIIGVCGEKAEEVAKLFIFLKSNSRLTKMHVSGFIHLCKIDPHFT